MPKGTSDAAGIAQCAAVCSNHSECGAYVFVSQSGPTPGGPRCALKAVGACALHPRKGVFSGYKNSSCHHAPTPPTPGPKPSPAPVPTPRRPTPAPAPVPPVRQLNITKLFAGEQVEVRVLVDRVIVEVSYSAGQPAS